MRRATKTAFRAFDLNQSLSPTREMILSPDDLRACFADDPPARSGPCFLGFDFGEAVSSTSAVLRVAGQRGDSKPGWPSATCRPWRSVQRRDSAPYEAMEARGELRTVPGPRRAP